MRSWNNIKTDYLVIGISAFLVCVFSLLLYADFSRRIGAGNAEQIGTITFKRREAQRKYASQVVWEDVEQNAVVYNNDSLRTSDLSEAVINLSDGTRISLDENSMILLALSGQGININFSHGSISASRGRGGDGNEQKISIVAEDATVSFGTGDVNLTRTEGKELNLTVTGGKAEVKTGKEEKIIEENQKAVIAGGAETRVMQMRLVLKNPGQSSFFVTTDRGMPVEFTWESLPEKSTVFLEISGERNFRTKVIRNAVTGKKAEVVLPGGSYYWRLVSQELATGSIEYSDVRKFSIIRDRPVSLVYPADRETISYSEAPPMINFRWMKNDLSSGYTLEVSRDRAFRDVVKSITTPLTEIAFDVEEGAYFWRVKTIAGISGDAYTTSSEAYSLTVKKQETARVPRLISPPDGQKVSSLIFEKEGFLFSWETDEHYTAFDLEVSRDENFSDMAFRIQKKVNFFSMDRPLGPGKYFWRVGAVREGSNQKIYSSPGRLEVVMLEKILLQQPGITSVKDDDRFGKRVSLRFPWSSSNFPGEYLFELSGDGKFLSVDKSALTVRTFTDVKGLHPGIYYWRVKLLDSERNSVSASDVSPLYLSEKGTIVARAEDIAEKKEETEVALKGTEDLGTVDKAEEGKKEDAQKEDIQKEDEQGKAVLTVVSTVDGAGIYVNKKLIGRGTATVRPEPGKATAIVVTARGFERFTETVTLKEGEQRKVIARMVKTSADEVEKKDDIPVNITKRLRWKANLASTIMSRPVIYKNIVVVASRGGILAGFSTKGGRLWRTDLRGSVRSSPTVHKGYIYIVNVKGSLFSVNVNNGIIRWEKRVEGPLLFGSQPLVENGSIYIATSYGALHAFSEGGDELWKVNLDQGIFSSITSDGERLFVGTDQSMIYALDQKDGSIRWSMKTDSRIFTSSPMVHQKTLYVGCYSGTFYAIDAVRGRKLWSFKAKKSILSSPVFSGSAVYVGSEDGFLYALDSGSGRELWKFDTRNKIVTGPDVSSKNIYVSSGRVMYSLDLNSGDLKWKEGFASEVNTPLTVEGNSIYFGLDNGDVVSLWF